MRRSPALGAEPGVAADLDLHRADRFERRSSRAGADDISSPRTIEASPGHLALDPSWLRTPLADAMNGDRLSLRAADARRLQSVDLAPEDRRALMGLVMESRHRVEWRDAEGRRRGRISLWRRILSRNSRTTRGTELLGLEAVSTQDPELIAKTLADIIGVDRSFASSVTARRLPAEHLAWVLREVAERVEARPSSALDVLDLDGAGALVEAYVRRHGRREAGLVLALRDLLAAFDGFPSPSPARIGVTLGLIVAGALRHAESLCARSRKRHSVFVALCDLVWASSAFMGPVGGVIGVGAVLVQSCSTLRQGSTDHTSVILRFLAALQLAMLKEERSGNRCDSLEALHWVQLTLLANGRR